MDVKLEVGQKLIVLTYLQVPFPARPSRSSIATAIDPNPTDKRLATALLAWEAVIDRLHVIRA